jgi:hypothetical protein
MQMFIEAERKQEKIKLKIHLSEKLEFKICHCARREMIAIVWSC